MRSPTPDPDALRQVLHDHITGRAMWDEAPALFLAGPLDVGPILWQVPLPEEAWGHPATVITHLAASLEAEPEAGRQIRDGAPPLWAVALRYEGFAAKVTTEELRARAAGAAFGLRPPAVTGQTPGSVETRTLAALDVTGSTYELVQTRGSDEVTERRDSVGIGRIPAALRRLVAALQG
ncbi:hypothetical protein [Nocardiopsis tropica]|uniref:Uncharacterized protein n=1 Tax=Nocardiopsis tropica TaxID=109330 RepID=A0ABU7KS44_9ACTN|nr:hypothetical protein [Nocardiopsis umidischolae]MEE2051809.1 hypothetical protein [Nocardiopsis umidischolae]